MPSFASDPTHCPICGETNLCAMEVERLTGVGQPPCWCMSASFTQTLLARVPEKFRGLACICARCAAEATASSSTEPDVPAGKMVEPG